MINLLEGVPGSGKSYEAVVYHVLPALRAGRKVITNLPLRIDAFRALYPDLVHLLEIRRHCMPVYGRWDAEAANRGEKAFVLGEFEKTPVMDQDGKVTLLDRLASIDAKGVPFLPAPTDVPLFGSVWDFYTEWRGDDGVGPLYVIDECHVSFPKIKRGKSGTADSVIQWFKISRHFGADVLLMTQRMGALEEDIAGLAEFHFRVRKASFLGRSNNYIRKVFAGYRGGEVSTDERQYLAQYFPLYKSHTQGQQVIENLEADVQPAHLKWRRASICCFVVSALGMAYMGNKIFFSDEKKAKTQAMQPIPLVSNSPNFAHSSSSALPVPHPPVQDTEPVIAPALYVPPAPSEPDPLASKNMHMTGCVHWQKNGDEVCSFAVSQNGVTVFTVTSIELKEIGFTYKKLGHCAALIAWKQSEPRAIVCDSPSVGMQVAGVR